MISSDNTPQENWRKIMDVYRAEAVANAIPEKSKNDRTGDVIFARRVAHTGKYPDRLKVTSIAE